MCYLLGNDFLPHIPSLDISNKGIEYLMDNYGQTSEELFIETSSINYLLEEDRISVNNKFLIKFVTNLAAKEDETLIEHYHQKKRRMVCDGDEYEKEIFRIENLQFRIDDPIKLGYDNREEWRKRYYKHYWDVEESELEEFSKKLVKHYLMGLKWVTEYYFKECASWTWYYPFDHPPFISDIAKYINQFDVNQIKWSINKPLLPFVQLLCVLPQQSAYLLPKSLQKLMLNTNSSLSYLYPIEFKQDLINKSKYWMAIPELPPLNITLVNYIFNKYKNELLKEELLRNSEGKVISKV
jgi:5'-3' exoribonuclease 2